MPSISILELMDMKNLALRPNCLLTRSPLVFISGPRSLFFYEKIAADLQDYLAAHGYQVYSVSLSFRSPSQRKKNLIDWLQDQKTKNFHFILASSTFAEFYQELNIYSPGSTFTVISLDPIAQVAHFPAVELFKVQPLSKKSIPLSYKLHQIFFSLLGIKVLAFEEGLFKYEALDYDRFLDHCIKLAENELST